MSFLCMRFLPALVPCLPLFAFLACGGGTASTPSTESTPEAGAKSDASSPGALAPPGANPDGGDADARATPDAGPCEGHPVSGACTQEGATACGIAPSCTDEVTLTPATCTCTGGQWNCGNCGPCDIVQSADVLGCGIGRVCDGVTLTDCEGTVTKYPGLHCVCTGANGYTCTGDAGPPTIDPGCHVDAGSDAH